jgi:hypothetical protein
MAEAVQAAVAPSRSRAAAVSIAKANGLAGKKVSKL